MGLSKKVKETDRGSPPNSPAPEDSPQTGPEFRTDSELRTDSQKVPIHASFRQLTVIDYLAVVWPERSRKVLLGLFAAGRVKSAGRPVKATAPLATLEGLELVGTPLDTVPVLDGTRDEPSGPHPALLYEDERFAVLDKPVGITVLPAGEGGDESCLAFLIRRELAARASKPPEAFWRYRVVHRLDRVTSGVVLFAKTPEVERRLGEDFKHRRMRKEYRALVSGVVEPARITVGYPLAAGRAGRMRAVTPGRRGAKEASTDFEVVERFRDMTLVRALPRTGRMHQIRVHAQLIGHPLCGDPLYGEETRGLDGAPFLHALRYELPSDWDEPRTFECTLPETFEITLTSLRRQS